MKWNDLINRRVGEESSKSYVRKLGNSFFKTYCNIQADLVDFQTGELNITFGQGLDIGFAGYIPDVKPILPGAVGIDTDFPNYDGRTLPFADNSQDYVYSSHCLEHIEDYKQAIREWYRVTKVGGHIVTVVPHQYLYEKKLSKPSNWNEDHKRFYTPASLLHEVEESLEPNSYRVRFLEDGDIGFDYSIPPEKHSSGEYEITLVIQKIMPPSWKMK